MKSKAFTLIEVMVVMAIISILAGMLVPSFWRFWESKEIATTKERMKELKRAMIGDPSIIQTGIRTSYGFVGDNGELPFGSSSSSSSLGYLVTRPNAASGYPHWNGPYMSGFDPAEFRKDAWGNTFSYYLCPSSDNRYLSGAIRSGGPNGKLERNYGDCDPPDDPNFCIGDEIGEIGDDICIALDLREIAPTNRIQGNFVFVNATGTYSASFAVKYRDPNESGGEKITVSGCKAKSSVSFPNFTTIFPTYLPIGKVTISSKLYKNSFCTGAEAANSGFVDYFISDNISRFLVNLPPVTAP
jgi:general secretion pathway protein G